MLNRGCLLVAVVMLLKSSPPSNAQPAPLTYRAISGDYFSGGPLYGTSLTLFPNGRFRFSTLGCIPQSAMSNSGSYRIQTDSVQLFPQEPVKARESWQRLPTHLIPIKWSSRMYLVDAKYSADFFNEVNLGDEPRPLTWGWSYVRLDFREAAPDKRSSVELPPVSGWPQVPPRWRDYILSEPIYGRVTNIQRGEVFTLNVGQREGVRKGVIFTREDDWETDNDFKVVWVGETMSLVKNRYDKPPNGMIRPQAKVKIGQVLSTRRQRFMDVQIVTGYELPPVQMPLR